MLFHIIINIQIGENLAEVCTLSGYPTLSWSTDVYNSWLAQNSQMFDINLSNAMADLDVGLARQKKSNWENFWGGITSTFRGDVGGAGSAIIQDDIKSLEKERLTTHFDNLYATQLAQKEAHQKLPNTATFGSNNTTLIGYNKFDKNIFTRYTIKSQFAKRIDDYFSIFGYETDEVKLPNINNRPNWNFIKTIDVNIIADIPQEDLEIIKTMFNNGFTLWHNPTTFLDYSQNNK